MKVGNKRLTLAATGFLAAAALIVGFPATAQAANWYTWYDSGASNVAQNVWHSVTTGASYNGAVVTSYGDSALAWVSITGMGATSATAKVTVTFAYQPVSASCKWTAAFGTVGPLKCDLRF
ncbi:hypothetical protein AB4Y63_17660 [Leifsonia sp. YAF41]|uniref:hypothetical protein n=1 Tax=Leifsonia sp. YAF41 TaxID=3233086 RepID=UPI003F9CB083